MPAPFDVYIAKIGSDLKSGKATELTYRSALELYMEALRPGVNAANDPKHIDCGAPDFVVEKGRVPLGYVETKDIGVDLNRVEKSSQMQRYLKALNNLILTDYLEFRWYVNGEKRRTVRVAAVGKNDRLMLEDTAALNLEQLFKDFYATEAPTVTSPKELAGRLAGVAHFIRDQIIAAFTSGDPSVQKGFEKRLNAFRELLLPGITPEEFADLYAQAMTYGLFAAKLSTPEEEKFTLDSAYLHLFGNKFLRRLFLDVSEELDEIDIICPYLHDIVSLLNRADFGSILANFGKHTRTEDPVVHFYETFLAAYDPKLRESRGVYYTPEPVVQFIVRSVDKLLKTRFGKPWGLADESVKVLDPATGTGTFLYFVIQQIYEEVVHTRQQAGQWQQKSKELLGRIFGFELLMAPYVVAHLKLGLELKELGAPLEGKDERLHVYLTNTLEEGISRAETLAGLGSYIAEESSDAAAVKKREDIMVVLGNPPYSGHSANASVGPDGKPNFIGKLLKEYYFVDGAPLGEKNPKWLQDDYVKFIRFGEWRIDQTGHGVLAFITNHGYLDNPTFRGMRQHLMKTFDEIYVLDLHGNSKKKEKAPDGGKDENVFDIQQGVAILLAVKNPAASGAPHTPAVVWHAELWGTREEKYIVLRESSLNKIEWKEVQPEKSLYLFKPYETSLQDEFRKFYKVSDIFPLNVLGFQTHRDFFAVDFDREVLRQRISEMRDTKISDEDLRRKYGLSDKRDWQVEIARKKLRQTINWEKYLIGCDYRPFDNRFIFFNEIVADRPRSELVHNVANQANLCLNLVRQTKANTWAHILVSDKPTPAVYIEIKDGSSVFPLYLYTTPEETAGTLFAQSETTRKPNLSPAFIQAVEQKLGMPYVEESPLRPADTSPKSEDLGETGWGPEDVFYYAYAVFHSPTYRSRYAEFLKIDFPRLPLTSDRGLFFALAQRGRELVSLHLLKNPLLEEFLTTYPAAGDNRVEKVVFAPEPKKSGVGRVYINAQQYFGGLPEAVWNFKIGGYQVCDKWLKDRKGRALTSEDINHYQRVVVALQGTIRLMAEIDALIPHWPIE